jgi:hypothetical protein
MATQGQITKIFAAAREVGWEREQVYELVHQVSGGESVRALSAAQTSAVIDALIQAGARPGQKPVKPRGRRAAPNETLLITPDQRTLIDDLRARLGGRWTEDRYLEGACAKLLKKLRPVTAGEAARVIEMLKKRLAYESQRSR